MSFIALLRKPNHINLIINSCNANEGQPCKTGERTKQGHFKKYIYKLIGKYIVHGFMQQSDDLLLL